MAFLPGPAHAWSTGGAVARISESKHYCHLFRGSLGFVGRPHIRLRVRFDDSARYTTRDPSNQADINKLWGFSDCSTGHHRNSARFGWAWVKDRLRLYAYAYRKGTRHWTELAALDLNRAYDTEIEAIRDQYIFRIDGQERARMPRGCKGNGGIKYRLNPYFGGDEKAPHAIAIFLQRLKAF